MHPGSCGTATCRTAGTDALASATRRCAAPARAEDVAALLVRARKRCEEDARLYAHAGVVDTAAALLAAVGSSRPPSPPPPLLPRPLLPLAHGLGSGFLSGLSTGVGAQPMHRGGTRWRRRRRSCGRHPFLCSMHSPGATVACLLSPHSHLAQLGSTTARVLCSAPVFAMHTKV